MADNEKHLDKIGLRHFWEKIKIKIQNSLADKVDYADYNRTEMLRRLGDGEIWCQSNAADIMVSSIANYDGLWVAASSNGKGLYYSGDGITWEQSNITDNDFAHVVSGGGILVAGGYNVPGFYYSEDGKTWALSNLTTEKLWSASFGDGIWVASCSDSTANRVYYSEDGKTWTLSNITDKQFDCAVRGDELWVAASNDNNIYYSEDGMTWTHSFTGSTVNCIATNGHDWVAGRYFSRDGINWDECMSTDPAAVLYDDNIWVAISRSGAGIAWSYDGEYWSPSNITDMSFASLAYYAGVWYAGSETGQGIYMSYGAEQWETTNVTEGTFLSIVGGGDMLVAGGTKGIYYKASPPFAAVDHWHDDYCSYYDLENKVSVEDYNKTEILNLLSVGEWTNTGLVVGNNSGDARVQYVNGMWFVHSCTGSHLHYSEDGKEWVKAVTEYSTQIIQHGIAYGNGMWLANAAEGPLYSTDGKTWAASTVDGYRIAFDNFCYGDSMWISLTGRYVLYSTDGISWEWTTEDGDEVFEDSRYISDRLLYNNGIWVATKNNLIYCSTDGLTWTKTNAPTITEHFCDLTCGDGTWVVREHGSNTYYSNDGMEWQQSDLPAGEYSFGYGDGLWIAICTDSDQSNGIYYSYHGAEWSQTHVDADCFRTIIYADGTWIATCDYGGFYYSQDGIEWHYTGEPGYVLDALAYSDGTLVGTAYTSNAIVRYSSEYPFASIDHVHDDRYYTKEETDEIIAGLGGSTDGSTDADTLDGKDSSEFAAATHTHEQSDVNGLSDALATINSSLDGKADTDHNHDDAYCTKDERDDLENSVYNDLSSALQETFEYIDQKIVQATGTLDGLGWDSQDDGSYNQTISVSGVTSKTPVVALADPLYTAMGCSVYSQATNSVTLSCTDPLDANIPVKFLIFNL